jgi:hypothetical protein
MFQQLKLVSLLASVAFVGACSDPIAIPESADLLAYCINPNSTFQLPAESLEPVKTVCSCINSKVEMMTDAKFKKAYSDSRTSGEGSLESMLAPLFQNVDPKSDEYRSQTQNLVHLTDEAKACRTVELAKY